MYVVHLSLHVAMQNMTSHIICHSHSHDVIPIPIPTPISSPKAILIPVGIPFPCTPLVQMQDKSPQTI